MTKFFTKKTGKGNRRRLLMNTDDFLPFLVQEQLELLDIEVRDYINKIRLCNIKNKFINEK